MSDREIEHCLGRLRWNKGTLQQLWRIDTVVDAMGSAMLITSSRTEWRDVPNAHEE